MQKRTWTLHKNRKLGNRFDLGTQLINTKTRETLHKATPQAQEHQQCTNRKVYLTHKQPNYKN